MTQLLSATALWHSPAGTFTLLRSCLVAHYSGNPCRHGGLLYESTYIDVKLAHMGMLPRPKRFVLVSVVTYA